MHSKRLFTLALGLALALALIGGVALLTRQVVAQERSPAAPIAPQAALGTTFTYQGRLQDGSGPVSGNCDFDFSLWDTLSDGAQVGSTQSASSVTVDNGYFSVPLDFGSTAFWGDARYLEITVNCGSGGNILSPRVTLNGTPYAHSLRPGAVISGTGTILTARTSSNSAHGLEGWSTATTGNASGVMGNSKSPNGAGVVGIHSGSGGYGVYGSNNSTTDGTYGGYFVGYGGVYGRGTGAFGPGVRGTSTEEAGGYFTSTNDVGVFGRSENSWGMYGYAAGATGEIYGVYGRSDSGTGYGVYGYSSASGHGVHGTASPPDGYGIYSEGNAYVEGELFWDAKTSYVAIATSAFIPELFGDIGHVEYDNEGYYLKNEASTAQYFTALVQLPHGAVVTELRVGWRDGSNAEATLYLKRRSMITVAQGTETMALVSSVGSLGGVQENVQSDDTIDNAAVSNSDYTYFLEVYLPATTENIRLYGVVIEYTFTEPY